MIIWNYDYIIRGWRQRLASKVASKVGVKGWRQRLASKLGVKGWRPRWRQ